MKIIINTEAFEHAKTLEQINRSALPVAIRGTLNDAVYDVKTRSMPKSAEAFQKRKPNFLKANSKFEKAQGFDVNTMKATVGFYENKLVHASTNFAVKDLEKQEHGGKIDSKAFIPMRAARVSGSGVTKSKYRRSNIRDFVDASKVKSISGHSAPKLLQSVRKQKLIRAAIKASIVYGSNAYVLGNPNAAGRKTLFKVERFLKIGDKLDIKLTPLFNVRKGRSVEVRATQFMERASFNTRSLIGKFFTAQAQKQFNRLKK